MRKVFQPPPFEWLLLTDRSVVSVVGVSSFPFWLPWLGPIHNTLAFHVALQGMKKKEVNSTGSWQFVYKGFG